MTYQEFISPFQIYDSQEEAKAKGYEAHHIIPRESQKGNETFDDRCVRLLPSEHAYAHILWDRENGTNSAKVFLGILNLYGKKLEDITYEDCLPYNLVEEQRINIIKSKPGPNTGRTFSPESIQKMSDAQKGHPCYYNRKGIPLTPETRKKQSDVASQCADAYRNNNPQGYKWNEFQKYFSEQKKLVTA